MAFLQEVDIVIDSVNQILRKKQKLNKPIM